MLGGVTSTRSDLPSGSTDDADDTADADDAVTAAPHADPAHRWKVLVTVLTLALAVTLVLLLVRVPWPGARPADTSPEVASRDMLVHHEQAVTMSFLVRDATDDADVDTLALDLIKSQAEQQGMFLAWLRAHDVPSTTDVPLMAWMEQGGQHAGAGHSVDPGAGQDSGTPAEQRAALQQAMGMATDDELVRLTTLSGEDAEVLFLQLMTRHHQGGVVMAEEFVRRSDDPELRAVADAVISGQNRELRIMANLLEERGASAEVPEGSGPLTCLARA